MPLRSAVLAAFVLVLSAACAAPVAEHSRSFVQYLENAGQEFVPVPEPGVAVVPPDAVVQTLLADGFPPFANDRTTDPPVLGVVQCGPKACRLDGGLIGEGRHRLYWVVGFPNASGANGGTAWAVVDAVSGLFVVGDGPPGP